MNKEHENPVTRSIKWLQDQGFSEKEATNLVRTVRSDSPERLWKDAPDWIEWCGKIKREHDCAIMLAAHVLVAINSRQWRGLGITQL
ncbi:hypothetical protein CCP4SC76_7640020 [Gammaproteobacteria bacterium]